MKIVNKVLISVSESDIIDGVFTNKTVTEVADNCFYDLDGLQSVFLPKVTTIGSYCFRYNAALTTIRTQINKGASFLAEKEGFTAHGETVKKAVSDLQFKIVAEKLKSEPIEADTIITINHYRLITGACEFGVKSWMEQNKVKENIKASELLPILKKTGAYGIDKFQSLLTF
jgi:hypothetical protein